LLFVGYGKALKALLRNNVYLFCYLFVSIHPLHDFLLPSPGDADHLSGGLMPYGQVPGDVFIALGTFTGCFSAGSRHFHQRAGDKGLVMEELGEL
jgi:hypothetical protein